MILILFSVSSLILLRNVFRVAEYAMGQDGYLLQHEWTLYIFDALLTFGVMSILAIYYPKPGSYGRHGTSVESNDEKLIAR